VNEELTRRGFLKAAGFGAAVFSAGGFANIVRGACETVSRRPNVLLIVADQHNANVIGNAGHLVARTPQLDRLAQRGVRFDRAYCQDGICVPSRTSFMTGLYPRTTGCLDNPNKITFSVYAAAALMHLLKKQRDAFGLSLFSETVEEHTQVKSSSVHQKFLYTFLTY